MHSFKIVMDASTLEYFSLKLSSSNANSKLLFEAYFIDFVYKEHKKITA